MIHVCLYFQVNNFSIFGKENVEGLLRIVLIGELQKEQKKKSPESLYSEEPDEMRKRKLRLADNVQGAGLERSNNGTKPARGKWALRRLNDCTTNRRIGKKNQRIGEGSETGTGRS